MSKVEEGKCKLIDLSHTIEHGMVTYKGLPGPVISDYWTREASEAHYDKGTSFHVGKIEMVANTSTYIDSPFHRYENGKDLSELALESVAHLDGVVFRADPTKRAIDKNLFGNVNVRSKVVLIHTGWDKHWGTEKYFEGHPFLTRDAAEYLRDCGAALVGIDSLNIDDTSDGQRPAHSILLRADIPIVEHLCNLSALPDNGFIFYAVPVKVKDFGTFPVRAFAVVSIIS
jgi:arylformamidase